MGDTLKILKLMVAWCPWCEGKPENVKEVIHAPNDTLDIIYESVPDCPTCRDARKLIAELEAENLLPCRENEHGEVIPITE